MQFRISCNGSCKKQIHCAPMGRLNMCWHRTVGETWEQPDTAPLPTSSSSALSLIRLPLVLGLVLGLEGICLGNEGLAQRPWEWAMERGEERMDTTVGVTLCVCVCDTHREGGGGTRSRQ
jgi:hypothetical protein